MDTLEGARHLGHLLRINLDTLHSWSIGHFRRSAGHYRWMREMRTPRSHFRSQDNLGTFIRIDLQYTF